MIDSEISPMMRHYLLTKEKYKDSILFYRLGDFYELFFDDAVLVSNELDLVLTGKSCGQKERAPMCGVPFHAADNYIAKLVSKGYKVAVCEQLTEPTKGVKIVERDVVKVITPGTVTNEVMLEEKKNNYILCIYKKDQNVSLSYTDITTGDFKVLKFSGEKISSQTSDFLARVMPSEIIANEEGKSFYESLSIIKLTAMPKCMQYYEWAFTKAKADENLVNQFGPNYSNVYEISEIEKLSAGALIEYLNETQKRSLSNINKVISCKNNDFMIIDVATRRNLELVETIRDRKKLYSLIWLLDKTKTNMGGRLFRNYIDEPLVSSVKINERLDAVEELVKKLVLRDKLSFLLSSIRDIERISGKIAYGDANPRHLIELRNSLNIIPQIKEAMSGCSSKMLKRNYEDIDDFSKIQEILVKAIDENASALMRNGGYINDSFNEELYKYRHAKQEAEKYIAELEAKEREATGIKNLKIGHNQVFGYYIEISKSNIMDVPLRYERKQTIANNERYVTSDLKELEERIFNSQENANKLEQALYQELIKVLNGYVERFQKVSRIIAEIDCINSLATIAAKNNYVKPIINNQIKHIKIEEGRHPVVEAIQKADRFISNDTFLNETTDKTMVITGPNMAGKSTYMRQVAVITFMAHIGSFVPAKSAEIAITDRIFTRVGASDDLAFGQSTFMVEMSEVANILANATDKSLIILDEIGRGTSTFDGLSIAWAVVEYLSKNLKAKTLFATHYHELTELEGILEGVKNYKISVKEINDNIVFLRKIVRGGANRSFGIEVASLAGLPQIVIDRAKVISKNLEAVNTKLELNVMQEDVPKVETNNKLANEIMAILKDVDINRITPMTAFEMLNDLALKAKGE